MAQFHDLKVTDVRKTTRDAVVVTLKPDDPRAFEFIQGQYLTFRHTVDGIELRRSYSICSAVGEDALQVGIKRVDGGVFSSFANQDLHAGMTLQAMAPMGNFHTPITPDQGRNYLFFAAGSGITPILSILKTVLAREPDSRATLIYANKSVNSIMFRDEIEDLKNLYMGRFNTLHILGNDAQEIDLFTGRIDAAKCDALFEKWVNIAAIDTAFICGPEAMMHTIAGRLRAHGLSDDQIKYELFATAQSGKAPRRAAAQNAQTKATRATVKIDGTARTFDMDRTQSILQAALENTIEAPFACTAGVCSTCKCKVTQGEVEMRANHALEDYEVAQGYVLSCQSYPVTDTVSVDYDQ